MNNYSDVAGYEKLNRELLKQYKNNDLSKKNVIVELNLDLVKKIAHKYKAIYNISFDDLFQEGVIGLIKAIDDFDISSNTKFSTYIGTCISNAIMNYINSNRSIISISRDDVVKFNAYTNLKDCGLDNEEIAKKLKISVKKLNDIVIGFKNIQDNLSLDANIENSDGLTLMDLYKGEENISELIDNIFRRELLEQLKALLTEKQYKVMYLMCGFDDCGPLNGQEVAKIMKNSREAVRKTRAKALKKLRTPDSIKQFLDVLV